MSQMLLDTYEKHGNLLMDFKNELQQITDHTLVEKVKAEDITLLSTSNRFYDSASYHADYFAATQHSYDGEDVQSSTGTLFSSELKGATEPLLQELEYKTNLLCHIKSKKEFWLTSEMMLPTLAIRTGLGSAISARSKERDAFLAKILGDMGNKTLQCVIRQKNGVKKVFAVMSDKYTYIPQTVLFDIIRAIISEGKMGKVQCLGWSIDHTGTKINLAFPEYAEEISKLYKIDVPFIPGIQLIISDIAESSLIVRGVWYRKGAANWYISLVQSEIYKKHMGEFDLGKIMEQINKSVFDQYRTMPEALCRLMKITVTTPVKSQKENHEALEAFIKKVFKEIKITAAIGKKREIVMREMLLSEIDETLPHTAYDLIMSITSLPERLESKDKAAILRLSKACRDAVYCNFAEKEEEILISA